MKKYIETHRNPLCNVPEKVAEFDGYQVTQRNCHGTIFYEVRNPNGDLLQNFTDQSKAEKAAQGEAIRFKLNQPPIDPQRAKLDAMFKAIDDKYYKPKIENNENDSDS